MLNGIKLLVALNNMWWKIKFLIFSKYYLQYMLGIPNIRMWIEELINLKNFPRWALCPHFRKTQ